jgi:hypothetical protein
MECAYYFVDGTWNVPTTLTSVAYYFDFCLLGLSIRFPTFST